MTNKQRELLQLVCTGEGIPPWAWSHFKTGSKRVVRNLIKRGLAKEVGGGVHPTTDGLNEYERKC